MSETITPVLSTTALDAHATEETDASIRPFRVEVPEAELADLRARLANARFAPPAPGDDWSYGAPTSWVQQMAEQWRDDFDWRAVESKINAYPQFVTEIDGQRIHFFHVRSAEPDALPIVLSHGWPGSFLEYIDLIDLLLDPVAHGGRSEDAFHVVIPSVPGYGFSSPLTSGGWSSAKIAATWDTLMTRLGYERYGAHGGDGGSLIGRELGLLAPQGLVGTHVLQLFSFPSGDPAEFERLTPKDHEALAILANFQARAGFSAMQSTRPQTIAHALADSPVGLLAWNELIVGFGDGNLLTTEQVLANASVYWFTNTSGSAARQYFQDARVAQHGQPAPVNHTPTGVSVFANDFRTIRAFAERDNDNIVFWAEHEVGGHFAAMEVPAALCGDLREFFAALR
ncbi:epoxide hydrolase family protein [Microbacterium sp. I2]|uniref:epoxide hydrolase family protein n=1 Tax=Microbacterium sp. I2 TaxID=3391826 RepID=UPI003EDB5F46